MLNAVAFVSSAMRGSGRMMKTQCRCRSCRARKKLNRHPLEYKTQPQCQCRARDHGDQAPAELERRVEAAKEIGKAKVTAKAAPVKAPSRPKVDYVVSCAVVLVNSLDEQQRDDAENGLSVDGIETVDASLLADLIGAVREMQSSGKPIEALDAI